MTGDTSKLNEIAEELEKEFQKYRPPDSFRDLTIRIDTSDFDRPTLIVQIDHESAAEIANEVESFLESRNLRTEREPHDADMVRVLGAV
jgi:hypothetical protein